MGHHANDDDLIAFLPAVSGGGSAELTAGLTDVAALQRAVERERFADGSEWEHVDA